MNGADPTGAKLAEADHELGFGYCPVSTIRRGRIKEICFGTKTTRCR
jgi:hypothetical protein